jgi:hypothetical protein
MNTTRNTDAGWMAYLPALQLGRKTMIASARHEIQHCASRGTGVKFKNRIKGERNETYPC